MILIKYLLVKPAKTEEMKWRLTLSMTGVHVLNNVKVRANFKGFFQW